MDAGGWVTLRARAAKICRNSVGLINFAGCIISGPFGLVAVSSWCGYERGLSFGVSDLGRGRRKWRGCKWHSSKRESEKPNIFLARWTIKDTGR
jgi:hypothetical protein